MSRAKTHGLLEVVEIKTQTCTYVQIKGEPLPSTYCETSCCKLPFDSFDWKFGWNVGREGGGDVRNFKFWLENLLQMLSAKANTNASEHGTQSKYRNIIFAIGANLPLL